MSMLGTRVVRREDPALVTGASMYVDDVRLPGVLEVAFVRSSEPHARVVDVDISGAVEMTGVVAVHTNRTLGMPPRPPMLPDIDPTFTRPALADEVVRFVGEPIAVVVARDRATAIDAAEAIVVEYEALPPVVGSANALSDEVVLFPAAGSNVMHRVAVGNSEGDPVAGADVIVRRTIVNHRMAPSPIEPRTIAAEWSEGRMSVYASTQGASGLRLVVAGLLGLDPDQVRVRYRDVGGGFGAKGMPHPEELVVVWLARLLDGAVRWAETRTENLLAMGHARDQVHEMAIGADREGRLVGLDIRMVQDGGAYPWVSTFLPRLTGMMAVGVYDIPLVRFAAVVVATSTTPVGAFRGAGRPEAAYAIERIMDELAAEIGLDPAELRRRNFYRPEQFPLTTPSGAQYDCGDYEEALDRVLGAADYARLRRLQTEALADEASPLLGIGMATYVEVTNVTPSADAVDIELMPNGDVRVLTGSSPQGQGHLTTWAMLAADRLGVPIDRVDVISGDTDIVPPGAGVGGSRSAQSLGSTVVEAADELIEQARREAARQFEADPDDIVFDRDSGAFHVAGAPALAAGWSDIATRASGRLAVSSANGGRAATFPFGAHVAVVEVDRETGAVQVVRFIAVDDCGTVINPMLAEGQVHGGIASGIAQALFEQVVYTEDGIPLTSTFADYGIVSAAELPSFETVPMETPTPVNPLGAKGIGESGTIGAMPAVVNAVVDALAHLGVRHLDTPLTAESVWRTMNAARQEQEG